jgi:hypothetical protein
MKTENHVYALRTYTINDGNRTQATTRIPRAAQPLEWQPAIASAMIAISNPALDAGSRPPSEGRLKAAEQLLAACFIPTFSRLSKLKNKQSNAFESRFLSLPAFASITGRS